MLNKRLRCATPRPSPKINRGLAAKSRSLTSRRQWLRVLAGGMALAAGASRCKAGDLLSIPRARRRVQPLCAVPAANYQHGARTPSVIVRSLPAVPQFSADNVDQAIRAMREVAANTDGLFVGRELPSGRTISSGDYQSIRQLRNLESRDALKSATRPVTKLIQLPIQQIDIAHCRVRDVALLLERSGTWRLSLRADQNFERDDQRKRNIDLQIKRNAFRVSFGLLRSSRARGENLTPSTTSEDDPDQGGKLRLVRIDIPEFWVQREAPKLLVRSGFSPIITSHFDDIDQAEFEIFVRLDPLTGNGSGVVQSWQREP